ncbi:MAG: UDP-N-acetylmuramate:L-alanyl-gamma-D-glutamyl-meso-diaminopimelate ligase [Legionellaceae bacterium]|nr:UDP-N-acetylmuramate:L-alanyl-gamma-D-glutamyl-meso-diaminopimelate ligase [Legionellaceae bacterium]|tara:strand:- start:786 stop:2093 length:1308 start_codon:yes stop_codon:yes gene_type:complete
MKIYILGICGTFMAGIAQLARQLGHDVSGCDENVYPPMSDLLREQGITLHTGYLPEHIQSNQPDIIIVGNVIARGNPAMEFVLNEGLRYISGPQWLSEYVLQDRWVLAVAGTHGKTTTASMLAWMLEYAHQTKHLPAKPGFLIGGVPQNFNTSARLGELPFFVIEADEYDTAFFDKRSKFVHYHPKTCILNNLEFDHADIFDDLNAIKKQFHHLVRTIPSAGLLISNAKENRLDEVLSMGCWTPVEKFGEKNAWHAKKLAQDASHFEVYYADKRMAEVKWSLIGEHNMKNALAAIAAAKHAGVDVAVSAKALESFSNVRRRLEIFGAKNGVIVYDDFAHHPTAIKTTIAGLRAKVGEQPIIAVLEPGSYTMRGGVHGDAVYAALQGADECIVREKDQSVDEIIEHIKKIVRPNTHVLVMSNKGFDDIHEKLLAAL